MNKLVALLISGLAMSMISIAQTPAQKADALLKQMTLDEKIGQMTQVTLGLVATAQDGVLDPVALKKAIADYKVGSILNVQAHALTIDSMER